MGETWTLPFHPSSPKPPLNLAPVRVARRTSPDGRDPGCHDSPRQLLAAGGARAAGSGARARWPAPRGATTGDPGEGVGLRRARGDRRVAALRGSLRARGEPGGLRVAAGAQGQQRQQQHGQRQQKQRCRLTAELHGAARRPRGGADPLRIAAGGGAASRLARPGLGSRLAAAEEDLGGGGGGGDEKQGEGWEEVRVDSGGAALPTVVCGVAALQPTTGRQAPRPQVAQARYTFIHSLQSFCEYSYSPRHSNPLPGPPSRSQTVSLRLNQASTH